VDSGLLQGLLFLARLAGASSFRGHSHHRAFKARSNISTPEQIKLRVGGHLAHRTNGVLFEAMCFETLVAAKFSEQTS
jgi:hypothetical protein